MSASDVVFALMQAVWLAWTWTGGAVATAALEGMDGKLMQSVTHIPFSVAVAATLARWLMAMIAPALASITAVASFSLAITWLVLFAFDL